MLSKLKNFLNNRKIGPSEKIVLTNDSLCLELAQEIKNKRIRQDPLENSTFRRSKQEITRVAAELGRKVIDLNRVAIATIKLVSITERSWRELDISEWENLLK